MHISVYFSLIYTIQQVIFEEDFGMSVSCIEDFMYKGFDSYRKYQASKYHLIVHLKYFLYFLEIK